MTVGLPEATDSIHGGGIEVRRVVYSPQRHNFFWLRSWWVKHFIALTESSPVATICDPRAIVIACDMLSLVILGASNHQPDFRTEAPEGCGVHVGADTAILTPLWLERADMASPLFAPVRAHVLSLELNVP